MQGTKIGLFEQAEVGQATTYIQFRPTGAAVSFFQSDLCDL